MKKLNTLLALVCLVTLFAACNNSGGSGEAYTLKMRLAKNDTFSHEMLVNMKTTTEAMGQKINMNMDMNTTVGFSVKTDDPGKKQMQLTYNKVDYTMSMEGAPASPAKMREIGRAHV